jgi:hypothetical protein
MLRSAVAIAMAIATSVALTAVSGSAFAGSSGKQVRYIGIHPLPKSEGGGICYIEGPHVHVYDADKVQYRDHHGANYFVGDPVAYGYDGKRYAYKGHHPIHVSAVVGDDDPDDEYCYITGPHYHYFAPPDGGNGPEFRVAGDAYFYVGDPPRAYVEARPAMMKINTVYQPLVYDRPVVTVDPPEGWIGARAEFAGPELVVEPRAAAVIAPRAGVTVEAAIPEPSVHVGVGIGIGAGIGIGVPGVIVHERGPAVIVRDRPVIIHERGPAVIVRDRPVVIHEHGRPVYVEERIKVKHEHDHRDHGHR